MSLLNLGEDEWKIVLEYMKIFWSKYIDETHLTKTSKQFKSSRMHFAKILGLSLKFINKI